MSSAGPSGSPVPPEVVPVAVSERQGGALRLTAPDNLARGRKAGKRPRGKYDVPENIIEAVANAGLPSGAQTPPLLVAPQPAPSPNVVVTATAPAPTGQASNRPKRRRRQPTPSPAASAVSLPLPSRAISQISLAETSASVPGNDDEVEHPSRIIDIWAGIEDNVEDAPPVWSAPARPPIPSSPPPHYRSPSPSSRASSPDNVTVERSAAHLQWEADLAAGLPLVERVERERARRKESLIRAMRAAGTEDDEGLVERPKHREIYVPVTLLLAEPENRTSPSPSPDPQEKENERAESLAKLEGNLPRSPIGSTSAAAVPAGSYTTPPSTPPLHSPAISPSLKAHLLASPPSNKIIDRPRPFLRSRHSRSSVQSLASVSSSQQQVAAEEAPKATPEDASLVASRNLFQSRFAVPSDRSSPPLSAPELPPRSKVSSHEPKITDEVTLAPNVAQHAADTPAAIPGNTPIAQPKPAKEPIVMEQWRPTYGSALPGSVQWRRDSDSSDGETGRRPTLAAPWAHKWRDEQAEWDQDVPLVSSARLTDANDQENRRRREGHRASLILSRPMSVKRKPPPVPAARRSWIPPIVVPEEESYASSSSAPAPPPPPPRPMSSALAYIPPSESASLPQPIVPIPRPAEPVSSIDRFEAASRRRPPPPPPASIRTQIPFTRNLTADRLPGVRQTRSLPKPPTRDPPIPPRPSDEVLRRIAIGVRPAPTRLPVSQPPVVPLIEVMETVDEPQPTVESDSSTPPRAASAPPQSQQSHAPLSQWTDLDMLAARHAADPAEGEDSEGPNESSYEPFLLIGEVLGPAPARPVDEERARVSLAKIELIRRRVRADGKVMLRLACCGISVSRCTICQVQYKDGNEAAIFPGCLHVFHLACLEHWLNRSRACPTCRRDIADDS